METAKYIVMWIAGIILVLLIATGITWAVQGSDFFLYSFWAPKYEGVRRNVFENTKSYNQGMVQELQNMQFEYEKSTPSQQAALRTIILHRAADYPEESMPADLRVFIDKLKMEETK
jgi:hypothetical protein